jgi:hypothetical protein
MKHRSKRRRADAIVSASELAQMGRCEQLVLFEHRHGQRRLPHQEAARREGRAAHERFEREGLAARSAGLRRAGRCFVASLLFGEAWQTHALRQFRDKVLRPRGWGRGLIRLYYRGAPRMCVVLRRWPVLRRPIRAVLGVFAAGVRLMLGGAAPR